MTRAVATESAAPWSPAQSAHAPPRDRAGGSSAMLSFALIPIKINTIYSGLPAHPLFLHVPVILLPVVGARRALRWRSRRVVVPRGTACGSRCVAVIALGATNLTMGAGKALRARPGTPDRRLRRGERAGGADRRRHASTPQVAADLHDRLFTAVLIVAGGAVFARTAARRVTGVGVVDGLLVRLRSAPRRPLAASLRVADGGDARSGAAPLLRLSHRRPRGQGGVAETGHTGGGFGGAPGGGGGRRGPVRSVAAVAGPRACSASPSGG